MKIEPYIVDIEQSTGIITIHKVLREDKYQLRICSSEDDWQEVGLNKEIFRHGVYRTSFNVYYWKNATSELIIKSLLGEKA